jgi:phage major head subunit gpT-like protein
MDVTQSTLSEVYKNLNKSFRDGATEFKPGVDLSIVCQDIPSVGRSNLYPFLDNNYRGWRLWEGARQKKTSTASKYELVNQPYENTVTISIDDFSDDNAANLAMHGQTMQGVGNGWSELKYTWQLQGLLENAACFDGKAFFASHTYGSGAKAVTVNNKAGAAFSVTTFAAALAAAAGWKWPDGMPTRTQFTHIFFGPSSYSAVFDVVGKQFITSGESNPWYNKVKMVECDLITGDYAGLIILADCGKAIKPAIRQIRQDGQVIMTRDPEKVLMDGAVTVLGYGRGAYGVTFPHLAYGFGFA